MIREARLTFRELLLLIMGSLIMRDARRTAMEPLFPIIGSLIIRDGRLMFMEDRLPLADRAEMISSSVSKASNVRCRMS